MRAVAEILIVLVVLAMLAMAFTARAEETAGPELPPIETRSDFILDSVVDELRERSILWESERGWMGIRRVSLWPSDGVARLTFEME